MTMDILDPNKMKEFYGDFYSQSKLTQFDLKDVPVGLQRIAHYATFWGLPDECERMDLISSAPKDVLSNLRVVLDSVDSEMDVWLAGKEATSQNPTAAYVAYTALRMAADMAGISRFRH